MFILLSITGFLGFFALVNGACLGPPVTLGEDGVVLLHLLLMFVSSLRVRVSVNGPGVM